MIPIKLTLKNFITYRELELDFSSINVACISGDNGAGKSSILDAMTWCLWEEARSHQKDNLIRLGENEMYGELIFNVEDNIYKVIRKTRKSKKNESSLEFQILSDNGYKSLTGKGIRETQNKIIEVIKMDYDTFINSVFILQGKADEFTTKKPKERKEILANMLNLSSYDILNEKAKEIKKEFVSKRDFLENDINLLENDIKEENNLLENLKDFNIKRNEILDYINLKEKEIIYNREKKSNISNEILKLETIKNLYYKNINILINKEKDLENIQNQIEHNKNIISSKDEIEKKHSIFIELKEKENKILENNRKFLELVKIKNETEIKIKNEKNIIENKINSNELEIKKLRNDLIEKEKLVKEKEKVLLAFEKYKKSKKEEEIYQSKINKFHELSKNKSDLEKKINTISIEFERKISETETKINEIKKIILNEDKIKNEVFKLQEIDNNLQKLSELLEHKEEKGRNSRSNKEKSEKEKESNQQKIKDLHLKIEMLQKEESHNCPMCNKSLDESDRKYLVDKYYNEIYILEEEIRKLELNIFNETKNLEVLTKEWHSIKNEIKQKNKEKVEYESKKSELDKILNKKDELISLQNILNEIILNKKNSINDLEVKLDYIKKEINDLDFSQEKYSMIQAEIKNWEWSENKLKQISDSEEQIIIIKDKIRNLENNLEILKNKILNNDYSIDERAYLENINKEILDLNYNEIEHENIKNKIKELNKYENLYQELKTVNYKISELESQKEKLYLEISSIKNNLKEEEESINNIPVLQEQLSEVNNVLNYLEYEYSKLQNEIKSIDIEISKLEDKIIVINNKKEDLKIKKEDLNKINKEINIYDILIKAFDKNGIPSLIIENIIPEIEADANDILSRITEGKMHISFQTIKSNKTNDKVSETLDIFINDELGIRNYEMYSGGEAFRINFAIRLALSKVLARRSGAKLRTLIIDEGFGTQDSKGISALIEAINSISNDFDKIFIVTHVNELKEAFESRIEVYKTNHGSRIKVI